MVSRVAGCYCVAEGGGRGRGRLAARCAWAGVWRCGRTAPDPRPPTEAKPTKEDVSLSFLCVFFFLSVCTLPPPQRIVVYIFETVYTTIEETGW